MCNNDELADAFHRAMSSFFAIVSREQTQQLANLTPDAQLEERMVILADKANEGELSDAERAEYKGYIEANDFVAVLQAEARYRLDAGY